MNGESANPGREKHQNALHPRSTRAPFLGQSETMTDNTDIELKKENTFKNNV